MNGLLLVVLAVAFVLMGIGFWCGREVMQDSQGNWF